MPEQQVHDSEVLHLVADYLEVFGWDKANGWFAKHGEPACLEGAGKIVCGEVFGASRVHANWHGRLKGVVEAYLTDRFPEHVNEQVRRVIAFSWNDRQKSAEPVIEVLRAAAVIEAAKENAEVREAVSA